MQTDTGRLIMGSHSLGNDEDIPSRCLDHIRTSDVLFFEEDRPARRALKAAGVFRDYFKVNEHNSEESLAHARKALEDHLTIFYMSDQGCPTVADPGQKLLEVAYKAQADIQIIPGPSSITSALSAFPMSYSQFHYAGFLPKQSSARFEALKTLTSMQCPIVILDTPYRIKPLLDDCLRAFGPSRKALVAADISGPHERYSFDSFAKLLRQQPSWPPKLNFVLIVAP